MTEVEDARLTALIEELSAGSDRFRASWERHDVELPAHPTKILHHPVVGSLELKTETFIISRADRHVLGVYHAAQGSPSERALATRESDRGDWSGRSIDNDPLARVMRTGQGARTPPHRRWRVLRKDWRVLIGHTPSLFRYLATRFQARGGLR